MKPLCPICHTEMLERSNIHVCPRNDIGDCTYDALSLEEDSSAFLLDQQKSNSDLRSYAISDLK
ncbi:hypothetical protein LYZ37_15355 [Vibrio tubiashii]|uniref:hypothetical protein n=1 Tax=Vibrio tubiashii TaxID=29498 RepID=UPI00234F1DCE|nr:hypothetical protein [Vibrio tubiashii]WCP69397.1 hypothetical protein LYZ37_15355 [Vibrio tubiashii]